MLWERMRCVTHMRCVTFFDMVSEYFPPNRMPISRRLLRWTPAKPLKAKITFCKGFVELLLFESRRRCFMDRRSTLSLRSREFVRRLRPGRDREREWRERYEWDETCPRWLTRSREFVRRLRFDRSPVQTNEVNSISKIAILLKTSWEMLEFVHTVWAIVCWAGMGWCPGTFSVFWVIRFSNRLLIVVGGVRLWLFAFLTHKKNEGIKKQIKKGGQAGG